MSWSISEIFKPFKILTTLYYQVKNSRRSQEFLNPIICHSCSFFKEYKNNQVSNEQYIPKHLLKASSILQKITCKKSHFSHWLLRCFPLRQNFRNIQGQMERLSSCRVSFAISLLTWTRCMLLHCRYFATTSTKKLKLHPKAKLILTLWQ